MNALWKLSNESNAQVMVISGQQLKSLEEVLGHIPDLGLAAANGLYISLPGASDNDEYPGRLDGNSSQNKRQWRIMDYGVDWEKIKEITLPILERYTAHTNGSSLRLQNPGIAWSYYSTDPEWGAMQAKALIIDLENVLQGKDVKVVHLKGMVELVPKELNKGVVLRYALEHGRLSSIGGSPADFILCIGDDASDEHMFTSINDYMDQYKTTEGNSGKEETENMIEVQSTSQQIKRTIGSNNIYTCTVGKKTSNAAYYLPNSAAVCDILEELARSLPN